MGAVIKYRNFDQFNDERKRQRPVLQFHGQLHHLPPSIPAATVLMLQRLNAQGPDAEVGDQEMTRLFVSLFGQHNLNRWLNPPVEVVTEDVTDPLSGDVILDHTTGQVATVTVSRPKYPPLDIEMMGEMLKWAMEAYGLAVPSGQDADDPNVVTAPA